jgi:hypothetical protein
MRGFDINAGRMMTYPSAGAVYWLDTKVYRQEEQPNGTGSLTG